MSYIWIAQQDTSDCGPACLAMVGQYYGKENTINQLRELAKTDREGTSIKGLLLAIESMGLEGIAGQFALDQYIDISVPCILHIIKDENQYHYVVLWRITDTSVIISDPAEGILEFPKHMFLTGELCSVNNHLYQWNGVSLLFFTPKSKKKCLLRNRKSIKGFLRLISERNISYVIVFLSLLSAILNITMTFIYQLLIDKMIPEESIGNSSIIFLFFVLVMTAKIIFDWLRVQLIMLFNKDIHSRLTYKFYQHLLYLPQSFFDHRTTGELLSRLQDINVIQDLLAQFVLTVFVDVLSILISGVILFRRSKIMLSLLLMECCIYFFIVLMFRKRYEYLNKKQMENEATLTSAIVEGLSGITTVKIFGIEKEMLIKLTEKLNKFWRSLLDVNGVENIQYAIKNWISGIFQLIFLWIGVIYVVKGRFTIGELVMLNALAAYLLTPVRNIINLQAQMQAAMVAYNRVDEIMQLDVEKIESINEPQKIHGDIEFKNIKFRYNLQHLLLDNMCMKICEGQKVAIIGNNGSGKSTIAKLLNRLYLPEEGSITINGIDINDYDLKEYRKKVVYVPYNVFLFTGTIKENITAGIKNVDDEKIKKVCEIVGIYDYIMELPFQYQTLIGENGLNISGGQKQKISLANAILKNPTILVLDEATSNIDEKSEKKLWNDLFDYLHGVTVIVIAHKSSVINKCDCSFKIMNNKVTKI